MTGPRSGRRRLKALGVLACGLGLTALVAAYPVTTKQGVNYVVASHRVPLYRKALDFVERSKAYERLAQEAAGVGTPEAQALAVFDWTRAHVKPMPEGLPVVDDHILNIITRGYGVSDQQADVFATLVTYAGVPAFWQPMKLPGAERGVILTFVEIDGRWRVFDVAENLIFRNSHGELATLDDLRGHPELVPERIRGVDAFGHQYGALVTQFETPARPVRLRAELQMPGRRLWHELKAAVHLEPDDE